MSSNGLPKGSEPSGGSTAGQVSKVPSSASGRWLPVAPSDANITSPAYCQAAPSVGRVSMA